MIFFETSKSISFFFLYLSVDMYDSYTGPPGFDRMWMTELCVQLGKSGKTDRKILTGNYNSPALALAA